jgi:integrase
MAQYNGVSLQSNGDHWSAYWIGDRGQKVTRGLGPKSSVTEAQARRQCRGLVSDHDRNPLAKNKTRTMCLGEWVSKYKELRTDLSPATQQSHGRTSSLLLGFFGPHVRLNDIGQLTASDWRLSLESMYHKVDREGNVVGGESTVCKHVKVGKQIMAVAIRNGLLAINPLTHLNSSPPNPDPENIRIVSVEEIRSMLTHSPSTEWSMVVGLCFYAGLRPSEAYRMEWGDWQARKLVVRNGLGRTTTKRRRRVVRVEPELLDMLTRHYESSSSSYKWVCDVWKQRGMSSKIVRRMASEAGLLPGVTLKSMRASRDTLWHEQFPDHVFACNQWMGHSEQVARKHYLRVPESLYKED